MIWGLTETDHGQLSHKKNSRYQCAAMQNSVKLFHRIALAISRPTYLRLASESNIDNSLHPCVTLFTLHSPHQVTVLFFSRPKKDIKASNPASINVVIETETFWSTDKRTQQLGRLIDLRRL